jgi:hypothetical protein
MSKLISVVCRPLLATSLRKIMHRLSERSRVRQANVNTVKCSERWLKGAASVG